jgi:hypothetical protein
MIAAGLGVWLLLVGRQAADPQPAPPNWLAAAESARLLATALLTDHPDAVNAATRADLRAALREIRQGAIIRSAAMHGRSALTDEEIRRGLEDGDRHTEAGARQLRAALARAPGKIEITSSSKISPRVMLFPFGSGTVLLHGGKAAEVPPAFLRKTVRAGTAKEEIELPAKEFYCALTVEQVPPRDGRYDFRLRPGDGSAIELTIAVRSEKRVAVDFDAPEAAAVAVYTDQDRLLIPANALDFTGSGYRYDPVRFRDHENAGFWPGGPGQSRCFFVQGKFRLELPEGSYRLVATKGPEYVPLDRTLRIPGDGAGVQVKLQRWIDMAGRGWHSGDCHIHYERLNEAANRRLELWSAAEDLGMGNVLLMGDGRRTYFEQYAFGKAGRFSTAAHPFVPGQEDPRTNVLGHTISLNLQRPVRDVSGSYYLYGNTFDEARRQGGLTGYAHVWVDEYYVHRDMSLNVARDNVDFAEICEFGQINTDLYYEFLNLGFRLTAVAGSDAPWGGTIGDSRVYVYTGNPRLEADEWFRQLRKGRTMVTNGPILELSVNGNYPGELMRVRKGDRLRIHARLYTRTMAAGPLEIVANGEVIRSGDAALDFDQTVHQGMWIAARTRGAHTTPVYVSMDGSRHWKASDGPRLVAKRLRELDEIERLISSRGELIGPGKQPEWEAPDAFPRQGAALHKMVEEARAFYRGLITPQRQ